MEIIVHGAKYKDRSGERVHFPKDGKPYFCNSSRRVFHNVKEKANYLNKHGFVDAGDSDAKVKKQRRQIEEQKKDQGGRL